VNVGGNFVPNPFNPSSILGPLADLSHLSYEWYRDSSSTAPAHLHPVLRLGILRVNRTTTINLGYLVFERVYNGFGAAPTNSWESDDIVSNNYKLWATASLGFGDPNVNINDVLKTIPEWVSAANGIRHPLCHLCQCRDRLWVERNLHRRGRQHHLRLQRHLHDLQLRGCPRACEHGRARFWADWLAGAAPPQEVRA
jgi:hypothetical protein